VLTKVQKLAGKLTVVDQLRYQDTSGGGQLEEVVETPAHLGGRHLRQVQRHCLVCQTHSETKHDTPNCVGGTRLISALLLVCNIHVQCSSNQCAPHIAFPALLVQTPTVLRPINCMNLLAVAPHSDLTAQFSSIWFL